MSDDAVEIWLASLLVTPGLTSITDPDEAWRVHVEDALTALPFVQNGPVADVGSGGGSPGIPLAVALPGLRFDLVESARRKCDFLRRATGVLPNVRVVCARAEDHARGEGRDAYAVVLARALAPPAVAAEWCLPLARPGGLAVLYAGEVDTRELDLVAAELGAEPAELHPVPGAQTRQLVVLRKVQPTPGRFPRRPGVARKRPLR